MRNIKKVLLGAGISALLLGGMAATAFAAGVYSQAGNVFSGPASALGIGAPYANDHLVMKWNAQWNNCNANGYDNPTYCLGAMLDNEWNGNVPNGSGVSEHYKIIWVGSAGEASPYWRAGGYLIWNNYEVIMDQGTDASVHTWYALATPNGYGAK